MVNYYGLDDEDISHHTNYKTIMQYQQKDQELVKIAQSNKDYSVQYFHGADKKYSLIYRNRKIVIPKQLEKQVVEWYHNALCHPGETRTELSISQHFYWKNLRKTVHEVCTKCKACQFLKRNKKLYGKLPPKEAETKLWLFSAFPLLLLFGTKDVSWNNLASISISLSQIFTVH